MRLLLSILQPPDLVLSTRTHLRLTQTRELCFGASPGIFGEFGTKLLPRFPIIAPSDSSLLSPGKPPEDLYSLCVASVGFVPPSVLQQAFVADLRVFAPEIDPHRSLHLTSEGWRKKKVQIWDHSEAVHRLNLSLITLVFSS